MAETEWHKAWFNPWAPPIFAPPPQPLPLPAGIPWGTAPPIFPSAPANVAGQSAPAQPAPALLPDSLKPFVAAPRAPVFSQQPERVAPYQPRLSDRTKDLPDLGGPLIANGGSFSPGLPAVNQMADSASASIGKAISNVPGSAYAFGKGMVQPFIHPVDTLEGFKNLGLGVLEKAGIKGGTEHEKYADALGHYYADRYGSLENLKRTFEQDPVGLAGDLFSVFPASAPLAGVRAAGVLERAGKVAGAVERAGAAGAKAAGDIGSAIETAREGAGAAEDVGSALKAEAPAGNAREMDPAVKADAGNATGVVTPNGKYYSVAFETKLNPKSYPGLSRRRHYQEANEALLRAIESDPEFAQGSQSIGLMMQRTPTGRAPRSPPAGWSWHHAEEPGVMQLVPRAQHKSGSIFQDVLHPHRYGGGGFSIWGR